MWGKDRPREHCLHVKILELKGRFILLKGIHCLQQRCKPPLERKAEVSPFRTRPRQARHFICLGCLRTRGVRRSDKEATCVRVPVAGQGGHHLTCCLALWRPLREGLKSGLCWIGTRAVTTLDLTTRVQNQLTGSMTPGTFPASVGANKCPGCSEACVPAQPCSSVCVLVPGPHALPKA